MQKKSILLLDDSPRHPSALFQLLEQNKLPFVTVQRQDDAVSWLNENQCDVLLLHAASCGDYEPFIRHVTVGASALPVIVVPREPSVSEAVSVMQAGAADYLDQPPTAALIDLVLARTGSSSTPSADRSPASRHKMGCANIIGKSKKMQKVFSLIKKVCDTDTTVLVRGESGTGKELIAQALHYEGVRRKGPFVPVNCGAIPGELLESELFGHEKGAFTHAIRTRMGRFELANGGTVFLDEISEMSPMLQVKILRVLQERQFERIGGTKTIHSDFRVVAATNRDLEEEVKEGRFREDLYYRLNVIPIEAPPLRERTSDIPLLVEHFIEKFNLSKAKTIRNVSTEALAALMTYPWPGNVRELENIVERMVILAAGEEITLDDLPERVQGSTANKAAGVDEIPAAGFFLNEVVADFEKRLILQALDQTNWVKNRAAKLLNVNRTTLIEKMKRFQLTKPASPA